MFNERPKAVSTVKVLETSVPFVVINANALAKMKIYVDECAEEIGWLGTATYTNKTFYIEDVFLFDQEVASTTTEITPEGLSNFAEEILSRPDGIDLWNNLRVWGHSHVNMDVFPSGQDNDQMKTFVDGGHDWFIRIIANKKSELKVDVFNYADGIIYENIPWSSRESDEEYVILTRIDELFKELDALREIRVATFKEVIKSEMDLKVRKKVYNYQKVDYGANRNYVVYGNKDFDKKKSTTGGKITPLKDYFSPGDDALELEIYETFSAAELCDISECNSYCECETYLKDVLQKLDFFTSQDIRRLWRFSRIRMSAFEG